MKNAKLKILEGNPGSRPIPNEPDVSTKDIPTAPDNVQKDKYALDEWNRLAKILHKAGLLYEADAAAYGVYCQKYAAWLRASEAINKRVKEKGDEIYRLVEVDEDGGIHRSELARVEGKCAMEVLAAAAEIGLTPKSRAKIGLINQQKEQAKSVLGDKRNIG